MASGERDDDFKLRLWIDRYCHETDVMVLVPCDTMFRLCFVLVTCHADKVVFVVTANRFLIVKSTVRMWLDSIAKPPQ